ncbi:MAG TPA: proline/glycine betaine ABC transporter permease [Staphylococcus sp.]|uniref:Proline/glycine betaine ABC transporter permease n=1 Tax=Mammaliicoccus vitulinus TaxID=71237 RepID=A0A2T4PVP4_9STAP|nr:MULTISPECIES: proline/glycine betaine ABC transporter permease [Mammaliicoccus]HAL08623.1 proline/glycine betaine ABC transporter permease [Staphylococcus sp.]MBM6629583.1 proline/glycine betaine ABC transporter permease [Mammaliicoccus vitulinus]MBO3078312.1 proline/glycine betaine ABC transporter permease [Mammaliicoccus vitulinus]MEB7657739.1 proline/glycine betaine ABC transporter permease [Mammaliicoccus vitulinus]PNZ36768.1 glycine/betaine ABC transporter [Mammaliicoccus vitulinus]
MLNMLPILPLSDWANSFVEWLTNTFSFIFDPIKTYLGSIMQFIISLLELLHPFVFIIIIMVLAFFVMNRKIIAPILVGVGLFFIYNQDLWDQLLNTMTLVIISSLLSVIIGIPLGILMSKSDRFQAVMKPILDFMQTMPAFVYLIPAVAFFGIGMVPGVFASIIFATPPTIRLTNLGIRQISAELIEASDAFGTTSMQKLIKVQLPLAKASIMAGVNQTVMLALSMVVIASMIGAPGLGRDVLSSLQRAEVGSGFVAGLSIVILAIIIDRFTQSSKNK